MLASTVAGEFFTQVALTGVPLYAVDVVVTSRPDDPWTEKKHRVAYPRNLTYVADLDSPASECQLDDLRTAVERNSAVLNLIAEAQRIGHGEVVLTARPATRDPDLPPGLRDFLVEKRQAILHRQKAASKGEQQANALRAHARIEPNTGLHEARTGDRNFQLLHDSPGNQAGYGLAPSVEEHQLGVLGTCLTHIFEIQAATRQVVLDSLEVRVEGTLTPGVGPPARYRNVRYSVHVESPASRAEIDGLREAVEASCPVYNLLKDPQQIRGSVVRGRYTGEAAATASAGNR